MKGDYSERAGEILQDLPVDVGRLFSSR